MRKIMLAAALGAVAAGTAVVVPAVSSATSATDGLNWGPCPALEIPTPDLQCTTVQVPLDYRHPDGSKIDLAVSRLPSKNPDKRRGVLLTNPGGPGAGGLEFPQILALPGLPTGLPQDVRDSYDVIGIDPRGVGHSAPVTCDLTPEQLAISNLPYANGSDDVVKQAGVAKAEAEQCANSATGWMLPHITTANTARDMDSVRAALGEAKASYLGASYGTYLGAVYTTMFPDTTDRVVLDSNLGPDGYDVHANREFGRGMEDRFPDFAKFVAAHPEYGLGTTPAEVTAKYHELAGRLDEHPVGIYTGSIFRGITFSQLYGSGLDKLAKVWQALDKGEEPQLGGSEASATDNTQAARFAVICGEQNWPRSVASYQVDVAVDRIRFPLLGAASANISACAYWQKPSAEPKVEITDHGPSNVLMVQNERDPGTPLADARKLRDAFGARARMVTVDQGGHGVYGFGANQCAADAVNKFLVTGERAQDSFCAKQTH